MTTRRVLAAATAVLPVLLSLLAAPALADSGPEAGCVDESALELRIAGRYQEALTAVRAGLEACRGRFGVPAWRIREAEALAAYLEQVLSMDEAQRRDLARADSLQPAIDQASEAWELDRAVELAGEQYELRKRHLGEDHPEVYASLYRLASAVSSAGDLDRASELLEEALELGRRIHADDHPLVAANLESLVDVRLARDLPEEARKAALESLEMRRRLFGENHTDVASSLHALAAVEQHGRHPEKTFELAARALAMRRKVLGPEHPDVAESLHLFGMAARGMGEQGLAERSLREAVAMRRRLLGDDHLLVAESLRGLANNLRWQGDLVEAEEALRQVIEIQRPRLGDHLAVAYSLESLAMLYRFRKESEKAYPLLVETVAIRSKDLGEDAFGTLHGRANLALNHAYRGDHAGARRQFSEIRAIMAAKPDQTQWGWLPELLDLYQGRAAERAGDYAAAVEFGERVVASYREGGTPSALSAELSKLGEYRAGTGDLEAAEASFEEAASVYETARRKTTSGTKSALFMKTPYEKLALCRLERGRRAEAWPAVEAARARVLADLLASSGRPGTDRLGEAPFSLEHVQASLERGTAIVGWLDSRLNRSTSRSWAYVIRHQGPVQWIRLDDGGDLDGLAERLRAFGEALAESGRAPFGGIPASVREEAGSLWAGRFAPLEKHLEGADELVLIPSSAMGGFPVAALLDSNGRFLGERFLVSHAPSSSFHAWLRETSDQARAPQRTALLLGDPPFRPDHLAVSSATATPAAMLSPGTEPAALRSALRGDARALGRLPRLRWSRQEISRISTRFEAPTILTGRDASEPRLASMVRAGQLEKYGVIHLATHALIDGEKPERSGLVLSQMDLQDGGQADTGGSYDGIIRGAEILEGWRLNADLVTLSACETALGQEIYGEGVVGLAYPFLNAGARSLLVSLWKVDDRATALFMERFYAAWLGRTTAAGSGHSVTKAEALRDAQQWLRAYKDESGRHPFEHPYYWSAFVLLGDPH